MLWTVVLLLTSGGGVWLAARHWWGWIVTTLSEILWAIYSLTIHSTPLLIMSFLWALIHGRNAVVTRRLEMERKSFAEH